MLTKSKSYYADQEGVREDCVEYEVERRLREETQGLQSNYALKVDGQVHAPSSSSGSRSNVKKAEYVKAGRNPRTVWVINPAAFPGSHFATFPPKLPEICIKVSTSEKGVCKACGSQWARVVEKSRVIPEKQSAKVAALDIPGSPMYRAGSHQDGLPHTGQSSTLGWLPTCQCDAGEPIPAVCLDPFLGSGTTIMVALRLGRRAIGIELSEAYVKLATQRVIEDAPLFNRNGGVEWTGTRR